MFRDYCADLVALEYLDESAVRFSERYAAELDFRRYSSRLSEESPRASFFASDYPSTSSDRVWDLFGGSAAVLTPERVVRGRASVRLWIGVP